MSGKAQGKRSGQRDFEQAAVGCERCPCGKIRYLTKRDAKKVLRRLRARKGRMHAYRCTGGPGLESGLTPFWHVGHVPRDLKEGVASRADVEARRFA